MTMKTDKLAISRTVELLNGTEVKKEADLILQLPQNLEEATAVFGDDLWKWARVGAKQYAQQFVRTKLAGGDLDGRSNKLLRQFRESLRTFVEVMEQDREETVQMLLAKEKFAPLVEYFNSLNDVEKKTFDFTSAELPKPKWFKEGEEAEEEEETETEETTSK